MSEALVLPALPDANAGDPHREIRLGLMIAVGFFILFLGWAALVPLDAGVNASGIIEVAGNRQTVQNKDGGIVTAIHVREGQHVKAGQVLIELAAPDVRASERALTSDYLTLLAQRSRLLAERLGQLDFAPPAEFASLSAEDRPIAQQAMQLQRAEMRAELGSVSAQQSVLGSRGQQLVEQQSGYTQQRASLIEQQRLIGEELAGLQKIAEKGFASMNRVRELQREQAALKGQQAQMESEYARAGAGHRRNSHAVAVGIARPAGEGRGRSQGHPVQAFRGPAQARRDAGAAGTFAGACAGDRSGRRIDRVYRRRGGRSRAEADGRGPGRARARHPGAAQPVGCRRCLCGQKAQIRFTTVHNRSLPLFSGTVRTVSADSFTDEKTGRSYFRAEIVVPDSEIRKVQAVLGRGELRPACR